jgi:hypothetical protein
MKRISDWFGCYKQVALYYNSQSTAGLVREVHEYFVRAIMEVFVMFYFTQSGYRTHISSEYILESYFQQFL